MSEAHELNVRLKVTDENTQPVMAGVVDQFNRTAEGLTRSMRGVTAEFDKLKAGMETVNRQSETHIGKGVSESFGKASSAVMAFASGLTGVGLGMGISEIARKTGELVRESSNLAAASEIVGLKAKEQLHLSDEGLKQVKEAMADLHRTTGITGEALTSEFVKFQVATKAQNLTLEESLKIYKNIGDFSRTTGADFDKMASMVTMAMTHMQKPVAETKGMLDGMAEVLGPMADDFARHYQRITPQLQQYGMAETKVMEIEAARFAALQQFYGEDRIGLMRAAHAEMQVMDQAMDPTSRMGMRVRQHILELQAAGRKEEVAPYIAQTMKEEGAFEREAGGAYTTAAIQKQRYWQIEQTATFIEQGMKAEEEATRNAQKIAEAKKQAGEVAKREAEHEQTQQQTRQDYDAKVEHAQKTIGEIWNKRVVRTLAHPEEFEGGPDVARTEWAAQNRLRIQRRFGLPHQEPTPSALIGQGLGGTAEQPTDPRTHPLGPPRRRSWWNRYQGGGTIPGGTSEEVPIIAHGGETVVPAGQPGFGYGGGAGADDHIESWPTDEGLIDTITLLGMRPWVTLLKKGAKFATMASDAAKKAKAASKEDKNAPPAYVFDKLLHRFHIPGYDEGGTVGGEPGQPSLIVAHGGETVTPERKSDDNTKATIENTEAIKELLLEFRRGKGGYGGRGYPFAYTPGAGEAGVPATAGAIGGPYGGPGGGGYASGPGGGGGGVPPILGPGGRQGPSSYPGGGAPGLPTLGDGSTPGAPGSPPGADIAGSTEVDQAIRSTAAAAGMDPAHWKAIASIESSLTPSSNANKATQYKGLFQIGRSEWARTGQGKDIYNAQANAEGAARLAQENIKTFKNKFGRDPTAAEIYLMHQQGAGFYTAGKMTNIGQNLPPSLRGRNPASISHAEFEKGWTDEVNRRAAQYASGTVPGTSPGGPGTGVPPADGGTPATGGTVGSTHGGQAGYDVGGQRYGHLAGALTMDGQTYGWGSGGSGGHGSLPLGDYFVNIGNVGAVPGGGVGALGASGWGGRLPPAVAGIGLQQSGNLSGFEIHQGSSNDLDRLYSQGCFAIRPQDWPRFRQALLTKAGREGKLMLHVHAGPGGRPVASITSGKDGAVVAAGRPTKDLPAHEEQHAQQRASGSQGGGVPGAGAPAAAAYAGRQRRPGYGDEPYTPGEVSGGMRDIAGGLRHPGAMERAAPPSGRGEGWHYVDSQGWTYSTGHDTGIQAGALSDISPRSPQDPTTLAGRNLTADQRAGRNLARPTQSIPIGPRTTDPTAAAGRNIALDPTALAGANHALERLAATHRRIRAEIERPIKPKIDAPKIPPSDLTRRQNARNHRERDKDYHARKDDSKLADIAI